ncbi:MAG: efflux RND transporter periplasmic adaptor subunit [Planctomycetes bacterium]|nr:efflux RND transporter periplasmic adaptor subunit [Planctomycetota bacterium]
MASRWRLWRGWIVAGLALAGAVAAWRWYGSRELALDVRTVAVARGRVEELVSSTKAGAVRSRRMADLSVDTAGTVVAILRREGACVELGEHLISIDSREPRAALDAAERELAVLHSLVPEARARLDSAVRERDRLRGLLASGSIPASQFDLAESQVDALAAACSASEARVAAQQVAIERARIAVEKCDLHAPFAGVVAELWVEEGEWATPGKVALRLLDPESLYVRAELDEIDLGGLAVGQTARVRLDPYRGRDFAGRVVRVAPYVSEAQEQNRTVEVEVELVGDAEELAALALKPGTSADLDVIVTAHDGVLAIPTVAVLEGSRVLVFDGERAHERRVRIGLANWDVSEVLDGLAEGERVIVSLEDEAVKDGALVRARDAAAPR